MAIKMRVSKNGDAICCSCGESKKKSLDMFDIKIGNDIFCLCDVCVEELFKKCLHASCYTNGRAKQPKEIRLIN